MRGVAIDSQSPLIKSPNLPAKPAMPTMPPVAGKSVPNAGPASGTSAAEARAIPKAAAPQPAASSQLASPPTAAGASVDGAVSCVVPDGMVCKLTELQESSQINTVVGAYRQFVDSEREKVEAKKQSIVKSERDKQLAELKKFQASFKVSSHVTFCVRFKLTN